MGKYVHGGKISRFYRTKRCAKFRMGFSFVRDNGETAQQAAERQQRRRDEKGKVGVFG
jgi:hypothetical protein